MKRHKYVFNKFPKLIAKTPNTELKYFAIKFLLNNSFILNKSAKYSLTIFLNNFSYNISKINTYCLITGRTRFTVKTTQTSRHIFFEYCSGGFNTGFYFG